MGKEKTSDFDFDDFPDWGLDWDMGDWNIELLETWSDIELEDWNFDFDFGFDDLPDWNFDLIDW